MYLYFQCETACGQKTAVVLNSFEIPEAVFGKPRNAGRVIEAEGDRHTGYGTAPIFLTAVLVSLLLVAGCGQPKVSGRVVFSDDQSPVTDGEVIFHAGDRIARGYIQPDGSFVVESLRKGDGLPPGTYKISLKNTQIDINKGGRMPVYVNAIDRKYESPDTSGLTLEVTRSQTFDIQVDRFVE